MGTFSSKPAVAAEYSAAPEGTKGDCFLCQRSLVVTPHPPASPQGDRAAVKPEFALCGTCAPLLTIVIDESGRGGAPPPSSSSSNEAPPPPPPPPTRVSEATLYRNGVAGQGSLQQTRRWNRPVMLDVAAAPSSSSSSDSEDVRDVSVSLDLAAEDAIHLRVRRFEPVDGDVTARRWVDGDGTAREKQLAPFALASIWAAAYDFKDYLEAHCLSGPRRALGLVVPPPHPVVGKVYDQAGIHFKRLVSTGADRALQEYMGNFLLLWFAIRHTTGSAYLSGPETLDMAPEDRDGSYPLYRKVSIPRMVIAQFDNLSILQVLDPLRAKVMGRLEQLLAADAKDAFAAVFVSVFMLLYEVSVSTVDRRRHGLANRAPTRYSLPEYVERLHDSANVILASWHQYASGIDPDALRHNRQDTPLAGLSDAEASFLADAYFDLKSIRGAHANVLDDNELENPLYFVMQMTLPSWTPHKTYKVAEDV